MLHRYQLGEKTGCSLLYWVDWVGYTWRGRERKREKERETEMEFPGGFRALNKSIGLYTFPIGRIYPPAKIGIFALSDGIWLKMTREIQLARKGLGTKGRWKAVKEEFFGFGAIVNGWKRKNRYRQNRQNRVPNGPNLSPLESIFIGDGKIYFNILVAKCAHHPFMEAPWFSPSGY